MYIPFLFAEELPDCNSVRVPKIRTIFGVVGILKLVAGKIISSTAKNYVILLQNG